LNPVGLFPYRQGYPTALALLGWHRQETLPTMPPPSKQTATAPADPLPTPSFPAIESFIERASAEEVQSLFTPVKNELANLKGPKAEQAKKAQTAIARTEELLGVLLETRERLVAESKGKGRK
jgi:hypothetical protein